MKMPHLIIRKTAIKITDDKKDKATSVTDLGCPLAL
jgi:hypothetical protein